MHTPEQQPGASGVQQGVSGSTRGHESSDVPVRPLLGSLAVLATGCLLALWLMRVMFQGFDASARARDLPGHVLAEEHQVPPAPKLEARPQAENADSEQLERKVLQSFEWIDRDAGVVRIPVERALEIVLQEGLPARAGSR